jgi:hypothetical protein
MVDTRDSKSRFERSAGSSPAPGTTLQESFETLHLVTRESSTAHIGLVLRWPLTFGQHELVIRSEVAIQVSIVEPIRELIRRNSVARRH